MSFVRLGSANSSTHTRGQRKIAGAAAAAGVQPEVGTCSTKPMISTGSQDNDVACFGQARVTLRSGPSQDELAAMLDEDAGLKRGGR